MKRYKIQIAAGAIAAVALAGYWFTAGNRSGATNAPKVTPPVPVTVARATSGEIPLLLDAVGRAEAYEGVTLKSRIDGQVAAVTFREGQHVKAGDILLRLDPGDFQAKLKQAEATLLKDQALLAKSRADLERYIALKGRGFVSEEKVNELRTAEAAAAATVKADQATLELARLQLSYTVIRAPFAGVVGARLVFPGSAVKVNDTALAVVNRVQPLLVTFSVPEKHLLKLRRAVSDGPMKVRITLPGTKTGGSKEAEAFEGEAAFIDNTVDSATGTIQMKATLENADERLTPGQFLNVSMVLDCLSDAILVPAEAVQQGAEGNYLYVVRSDNTVEPRKIDVLATYRGQAAIAKGVTADEMVVTDGQLRLTPGATIKAKSTEAKDAPPAATPGAPSATATPASTAAPATVAPAPATATQPQAASR